MSYPGRPRPPRDILRQETMGLEEWGSCRVAAMPSDKEGLPAPRDVNGVLRKGVMMARQG